MDEVLADFSASVTSGVKKAPPEMYVPGFFRNLKVKPGAKRAVSRLMKSRLFDIYVLSHPINGVAQSYSEKVEWIKEHFPRLTNKIVLTCNKNLNNGHFLIDDSVKWKSGFNGIFVRFSLKVDSELEWVRVVSLVINTAKFDNERDMLAFDKNYCQ